MESGFVSLEWARKTRIRLPLPYMTTCTTESSAVAQPITFHAPHKTPARPASGQRQWSVAEVQALLELPFNDLLFQAQTVHRAHFDPNMVELATLLSVKTGGCPEDCSYCPQSVHFDTGVEAGKLMGPDAVRKAAEEAKAAGATRFCMGAAWRAPKDRDIEAVAELVRTVKSVGLESCATLGMLSEGHAEALRDAGLDYYNHNLDSAPDFYGDIITTRDYQDRLDTLARVRNAGVSVCCGGIVGLGESRLQRAALIAELANLSPYPESVPINHLVKVEGTPLADQPDLDPLEFVRTVAVARITMPKARVRLSAGRQEMGDAVQALCFAAGANSIFYGEKLLTTPNPDGNSDMELLGKLGLKTGKPMPRD
jgi:biotin synthase